MKISIQDIDNCVELCHEFIRRAEVWKDQHEHSLKSSDEKWEIEQKTGRRWGDSLEKTSLIRCSLDLWRALANMRNNGREASKWRI